MHRNSLQDEVVSIVTQATLLKDTYLKKIYAPVNYVCIFCQQEEEFLAFQKMAQCLWSVIKQTPTGPIFHIAPVQTISGDVHLLKIRLPDPTRPERWDADFTIEEFLAFEKTYLSDPHFTKIQKENFYMIELMDSAFDVRAYFSNPPLDQQLAIKSATL